MYFNDYINNRRKQLNMSVDDLVEASGIPKGTLSKITAGINTNPTLSTIEAICKALDCSIDEAVVEKKSPTTNNSEDDKNKQKLINNYDLLNNEGQQDLVEYSDMLAGNPRKIKESDTAIPVDA